MLVVVLPSAARFADVEEVVLRCGLAPFEHQPQVFPARPEPARVAWTTDDGASVVEFHYQVNPDRRSIRFQGPDAGDLRRACVSALGELGQADLERAVLVSENEADVFVAAFHLAELLGGAAIPTLLRGAASRPDHAAWGCMRAVEPLLCAENIEQVQRIREDPSRPAAVRALAADIVGRLFHA